MHRRSFLQWSIAAAVAALGEAGMPRLARGQAQPGQPDTTVDALVDRRRGEMQALTELGVAQARILGENAQQCSVEPVQGDAGPCARPNRIRICRHDPIS